MALESSPVKRFATYPVVAALVLGGLWFLCGYFGPIFLAPDANQGPLLGIFITGPLGAATGIVVGLVAAAISTSIRMFGAALAALALVGSGVVLYVSLPEDLYEGVIIDASIRGCGPPAPLVPGAIAEWEKWNQETTWRKPRAGWKADIERMLREEPAVLLTMFVYRQRKIYRVRRPWKNETLRADPWEEIGRMQVYFSRNEAQNCSSYELGQGAFYSPKWDASIVSPPDILPTFLGIDVLIPVAPAFIEFVRHERPAS